MEGDDIDQIIRRVVTEYRRQESSELRTWLRHAAAEVVAIAVIIWVSIYFGSWIYRSL